MAKIWVEPYTKDDGTRVNGHYRDSKGRKSPTGYATRRKLNKAVASAANAAAAGKGSRARYFDLVRKKSAIGRRVFGLKTGW